MNIPVRILPFRRLSAAVTAPLSLRYKSAVARFPRVTISPPSGGGQL